MAVGVVREEDVSYCSRSDFIDPSYALRDVSGLIMFGSLYK